MLRRYRSICPINNHVKWQSQMLTSEPRTPQTLSKSYNQQSTILALWVKLCLPSHVPHPCIKGVFSRCQWPRGLRRRSTAARLLWLWARIPPGAWMFVCCECCVLSGRGLCNGLITRPEESYRMWCVWVRSWSLDNEKVFAQSGLAHQKQTNKQGII